MKSPRENNEWHSRIAWAFDHQDTPEALKPDISWELAEQVWQSENSQFVSMQQDIYAAASTMEGLREYLGFKEMDQELWCSLSTLLYCLLERDDISNIDKVVARIKEFVVMCPYFYKLRFGGSGLARSHNPNTAAATSSTPDNETPLGGPNTDDGKAAT